jgi:hypothetical protein
MTGSEQLPVMSVEEIAGRLVEQAKPPVIP